MGQEKEPKKGLKIYEIAIFMAFFCACYVVSIPYKERLLLREISPADLQQMSAQQYIGMMYWTSYLTFSKEIEIQGWPRREDLPYLLTLIQSRKYSGEVCTKFAYFARSITTYDYGTTESIAALHLLKALKDGKFEGYGSFYPPNKDEIIAWARAEAEKMESERAVNPR